MIYLDNDDRDDAVTSTCWASELKCRQLVKILLYYGCVQLSSFLGALIRPFFDIFLKNNDNKSIDTSEWNLPFAVVMPVNMQTISGWFVAWFYQLNTSIAYGVYMITTTTHFVCLCYWIVGMCNHFSRLIESIRNDTQQIEMQKNNNEEEQQQAKRWQKAKAKFQRAIEMHVNIYE